MLKPWMKTALLAAAFALLFWTCAVPSTTSMVPEPLPTASLEPGSLPEHWINGTDENEPLIQVHAYNDDLYILRQSKRTDYEAPFLYLIFGDEKVILLDTGSRGKPPVRETVERVIKEWCAKNNRDDIHLIVSHTHGHGDHRANDYQFRDRDNTTYVSWRQNRMQEFFGITDWPTQLVEYDLGNRVLDVIPTPGHHRAHLVFYDRRTGVLLSGDTFYPGFLFVFRPADWQPFRDSTKRLVDFVRKHPIATILGCHVEMTDQPKHAFAYRTKQHPDERVLELTVADLEELHATLEAMDDKPYIEPHDSFIVYPAWQAERFGAKPPVDGDKK